VIQRINAEGATILVVEQNVWQALEVSDYAYILENGSVVGHGASKTLMTDQRIQEAYLGI
jgi:branched-chain amino acid transport system ATP-binding protein